MPIHLMARPSPGLVPRLDRREFLSRAAFGALALTAARSRAADNHHLSQWLALVSDTHVAADPATRAHDQVMADNLRTVVAEILAQPDPPAAVVVDGDLALKDGQAGDYATFLKLVEPLRNAGVPLHLALGNHDDREHFGTALEIAPQAHPAVVGKYVSTFDGVGLRWIVLDSLDKVNAAPGRVGAPQRAWLAQQLDALPETPAVVLVHHNLAAHNPIALSDTAELMDVLRPRRQAKAVVFGHTHVWNTSADDGLHLINLPAVGYPFVPIEPIGWCKLRPTTAGIELELRAIGGNRSRHGQRVALSWRGA